MASRAYCGWRERPNGEGALASGGRHRRGWAVTRTRSPRGGTSGEKPAVKCRSALRALFVGPKGQQHAVDRAAGRLPSRVVLESDSPPRLGVDRRSVRVTSISSLRRHARHAGYTARRRAFGPGREPLATRRLNPAAPPAKRRATISLDAFTGSEKEIGLMATGQRARRRSHATTSAGARRRPAAQATAA